jgi:3-deoxy-D-manno-octulosonate 8-phosphate phosphatase (KDO 8-P phosphatase)
VNVRLGKISLVAFDIDGVFTDGRFYLSDDGTETKAFSTQDGYGIRRLLDAGIHVAVISGRKSTAVELRMQELGVAHVVLGTKNKVQDFEKLLSVLGVSASHSVFVGDDIPDLPLLRKVGTPIAVANAVQEVKDACKLTTRARGGFGAVREVCDLVLTASPD